MKTIEKCQSTMGIKVIFKNSRYSIETYLNGNNEISLLVVKDDTFVDYPIKYDNGDVAFDNPYMLPKYIKNRVIKTYANY